MQHSPTEESPGTRIFQLTEIRALNDTELVEFYEQASELTQSPDRAVWAKALINQQNAELVLKERVGQVARRQKSIFEAMEG